MQLFFEILSWTGMIALIAVSIPQIILNHQKKSTKGVSWPMFGLLLFGLVVLFVRSLLNSEDLVICLNFGLGSIIALIANLQIFYYRKIKKA